MASSAIPFPSQSGLDHADSSSGGEKSEKNSNELENKHGNPSDAEDLIPSTTGQQDASVPLVENQYRATAAAAATDDDDDGCGRIVQPTNHHQWQRYKLIVSYNGSRFKGFQRQSSATSSTSAKQDSISGPAPPLSSSPPPNPRHFKRRRFDCSTGRTLAVNLTVQECLEDALELYSGWDRQEMKLRFAGRTDAGVHARGQVVAVFLPPAPLCPSPDAGGAGACCHNSSNEGSNEGSNALWHVRRAINSRLPVDISVEDVSVLSRDRAQTFDPRRDVVRKQYSYTMRYRRKAWSDGETGRSVHPICAGGGPHLLRTALDPDTCWICPWALDDTNLEGYCAMLAGTHDYSAFVHKEARMDRDNHMTVERLDCHRLGVSAKDGAGTAPVCDVRFLVEATGFGRAQVRNLIGFLVDLCRGAIDNSDTIMDWMWDAPADLTNCIHAAPACGLCLEHVFYDER
jgi:tRNA pseudouridine(38-40) synthase